MLHHRDTACLSLFTQQEGEKGCGLDHERLTYRYAGRDFRLTDVAGHVVKDIFA